MNENHECPVCGKECEFVFVDIDGEVCGCNNCIERFKAKEYLGD